MKIESQTRSRLKILETSRLDLRELTTEDAAFILALVNEPAWLRFIGDRGIKTLAAARDYILHGPVAMYGRLGFGLWLVEDRESQASLGICGLIKRDTLPDIDLGFAFLSAYHRNGYAFEAATATMAHARTALGLARVVAVVSPDNEGSCRLLEKLGFRLERTVCLTPDAPATKLYAASV